MNRLQQKSNVKDRISALAQGGIISNNKVFRIILEREKRKSLGKFHACRGLCLHRRGPLAHLFFGSGQRHGIFTADTEIDGNVQSSIINPFYLTENLQIKTFQFL